MKNKRIKKLEKRIAVLELKSQKQQELFFNATTYLVDDMRKMVKYFDNSMVGLTGLIIELRSQD